MSDFFVLFKGGVYTFLVRRFFMCAYLVVARMNTFFFVFDLFSFYYRFTNLKYLPSGENFCLLNGGENKNLCT